MRVALVSDCYLPRLGGIEVQVADLAGQLRQAGHEVVVVTATPGPPAEDVLRSLPPVPLPVPVNPWGGPLLRLVVAGADVVHAHLGVVGPFASHGVRVALRAGVPTVVTWHSVLASAAPRLRYAARWRRWLRAGARATAVSEPLRGQLQGVVGDAGSVEVLHNGIDTGAWAAPGPPPDDGTLRLVSATRFARRKRPWALLELARRIRAQVPEPIRLELTVAGDGPLLAPVRALARRQGMDWVRLPGRLSREELAGRYHRSHLYLAPARLESFGIAALEARTAGLPVIGRADSGVGEFVTDGVHGLLARDDEQLAELAAGLIRDPGRMARIARHNRETEPEQAWPREVAATLAAYRGEGAHAAPGGH